MKYLLTAIALAFVFSPQSSMAQKRHVGNALFIMKNNAGEIQSTVIPPALKTQCPKGRILISRDYVHPPTQGTVVFRDIDKPSSAHGESNFENVPDAAHYKFLTNDHDLITLPNGDILYITAAGSKRPIANNPAWFDLTFRKDAGPLGDFGPGARGVVLTWRSTDGGENFKFLSEFDPINGDGLGAHPQIGADTVTFQPPYDMGGTDGQLVSVVPGTDVLFMTFQIVGYHRTKNDAQFRIDPKNRIDKTLLLTSKAGGPWKTVGIIDGAMWRLGMVPMSGGGVLPQIAFGASTGIFTGKSVNQLPYSFTKATIAKNGRWGWAGFDFSTLNKNVNVNMIVNTVVSRVPGSSRHVMLVFPDDSISKRNACRVLYYSIDNDEYMETNSIVPLDKSPKSCVMHPTIVDSKTGPVLLYWYDLNATTMQGKIRGRIITALGSLGEDFDISMANGKPYSFDLTMAEGFFYGDYHTAGGYVQTGGATHFGELGKPRLGTETARFFPVWVQPDKVLCYGEVAFTYDSRVKVPPIRLPVTKKPFLQHVELTQVISLAERKKIDAAHHINFRARQH